MIEVFVPREQRPGETRVAATPETVRRMVKAGLAVRIENDAGAAAHIKDADYEAAGAVIANDALAAWRAADLVLKVSPPVRDAALAGSEAAALKSGAVLVGFMAPHKHLRQVQELATGNVTTLAMELVPRITRAQAMDALSSQANIAGYKAVLLAAARLDKYFPLLMTAAGTVHPARVVVMGAGVAGLQAVATARRLGAVVEVSDIRPAAKEQVESLGAKFIELPEMQESGEGSGGYARQVSEAFLRKQQEIVAQHVSQADVVITTALVPGKPAPKLISAAMVESMRSGAVIVDLASAEGGNCDLSEDGEEVIKHDVVIIGDSNLAASVPADASSLYARNVLHLVLNVVADGELRIDVHDEVTKGTLLTHQGAVVHEPTAALLQASGAGGSGGQGVAS